MHADCAYVIGQSHEVCQDYARAGLFPAPDVAYAVVSDGCSMGKDSDVGARILTLLARQRLLVERFVDWSKTEGMMALARERAWTLGLAEDKGVLDATLLIATADTHGSRRFVIFGDGVYVSVYRDGSYRLRSIEFSGGYPLYLSYSLNRNRFESYCQQKQEKWIDVYYHDPRRPEHLRHDRTAGSLKAQHLILDEDPGKDVVLLLIASDGLNSFRRMGPNGLEAVPLPEVMELLLQFKTFSGRFVQRRLNRFLKDVTKLGWAWHDDVSVAGIYLGDTEL
jgi:hypothetical protein